MAIAECAMESEYRVPAVNGDCSIICHVGSAESGFLENCLFLLDLSSQVTDKDNFN